MQTLQRLPENFGYSSSKPMKTCNSNSITLCVKVFQVFLLLIFEYPGMGFLTKTDKGIKLLSIF